MPARMFNIYFIIILTIIIKLSLQAKLWNTNHRPEHVRPDLMATLADLGLTYLDSYVIHWPMAVPSSGEKAAVRPDGCYPAHKSKVRRGTSLWNIK